MLRVWLSWKYQELVSQNCYVIYPLKFYLVGSFVVDIVFIVLLLSFSLRSHLCGTSPQHLAMLYQSL